MSISKKIFHILNRFIKHHDIKYSYRLFLDFSKGNKPLTLDIGCGNGTKTLIFKKLAYDIIGLDIFVKALKKAKDLGIACVRADAHFLPFKNNVFGAVVSFHMIEHLKNPSQTLKEIHRILEEKGFVILVTPNRKRVTAKIGLSLMRLRGSYSNCRYPLNPDHIFEYDEKGLNAIIGNFSKASIIPLFIGFKVAGLNIEMNSGLFKKYCDQWILVAIK